MSAIEVRIPREIVNDDVVTLGEWLVSHGARVRPGQVVVSVETSKASVEVEVESEGVLEILEAAGSELPVGAMIGRILSGAPAASGIPAPVTFDGAKARQGVRDQSGDGSASQLRISGKAAALIEKHGLSPSVFGGLAFVREADVEQYLASRTAVTPQAPAPQAADAPPAEKPLPPPPEAKGPRFLHDATSSARDRNKSIVWVALNYLFRNWFLGNLVPFAPRGIILPLHRLRGVKIGADCFVDPTAILETAYPENIRIGNDVRITARAVIMTHIKAPNYLRETGIMPVVLKPVVLRDHCFIGVNAVILPGVTIGEGAVVASGSVVSTNVAPFTLVSGNPAKVVKRLKKS